jgi:hypothetical protein
MMDLWNWRARIRPSASRSMPTLSANRSPSLRRLQRWQVHARGPLLGVPVEERVGCDVVAHVGDVHPEAPPAAVEVLDADGVVEVLGVRRVDGPAGDAAQVGAARVLRDAGLREPLRRLLGPRVLDVLEELLLVDVAPDEAVDGVLRRPQSRLEEEVDVVGRVARVLAPDPVLRQEPEGAVEVHAEGLHGAQPADARHRFAAVGDAVPVDELHHRRLDPSQRRVVAFSEPRLGKVDAVEGAPLVRLLGAHELAAELLEVLPRRPHPVVLGLRPGAPQVAAAGHGLETPRAGAAATVEGLADVPQLLGGRGAVVRPADLLLREGTAFGTRRDGGFPERLLKPPEVLLRLLGQRAAGVLRRQVPQACHGGAVVLEVAVVAGLEGAPRQVLRLRLLLAVQRDEAHPGNALLPPAVREDGEVPRRLHAEEAGLELHDVARLGHGVATQGQDFSDWPAGRLSVMGLRRARSPAAYRCNASHTSGRTTMPGLALRRRSTAPSTVSATPSWSRYAPTTAADLEYPILQWT